MDLNIIPQVLMDFDAQQQYMFMVFITKNDMLYSGMMDEGSPNLIPFHLATIRELAGTGAQMEAAYNIHRQHQAPLKPSVETDKPMESHYGQKDRTNEFRTYYARQLVAPGAPLRDNLIAELFQGGSTPLWMGLFACYGLPLVHLADSMEVKAATYAKQALALAASNLDDSLCALFTAITTKSKRHASLFGPSSSGVNSKSPHKWTRAPLAILRGLALDGRLSGLPLVLPGYVGHAEAGRHWSNQPIVGQVVLECVWQWDLAETVDPLDALEELGHVAVALACGTHKTAVETEADGSVVPAAPEFDFYLCFLPTLVYALRVFLVNVRQQYPAVSEIALALVRCLWAQMVLVYILQLRPKIELLAGGATADVRSSGGGEREENLLDDFYSDITLASRNHQDAFYLRALRSFAMLAASERDAAWQGRINDAAVKFKTGWQRWLGFGPDEEATLDIRL